MSRFNGKRVLVTGGTSGIGLATARRIAEEGGKVAVTGRNQDRLDAALALLPEGSLALQNDAGDPAAADELARFAEKELGGLDVLFLNAGYGTFASTTDNTAPFFDDMMNANVRGPILQMAKLAPMISDNGSVVLTSSVAEYLGMATSGVYSATKAALTSLARSYASDLAPRGIRVNSVAPGPIETNFFDASDMSEEEKNEFAEHVVGMVPLRRFGSSEEVAAVVTFLLSDEASFVTASQYMVDGGISLR